MPRLVLLIFPLLFLGACAVRSVYVPATQNVMLFDDKKQIQANAYVGTNTAQIQLAHNPVNRFAMGMSVNYGSGLSIYEGYLGMYGYAGSKRQWRFELQGGGGYTSNFSEQNNAFISKVRRTNIRYETYSIYNKAFIQPAAGFFSTIDMYKLKYCLALSCRASYLDFKTYEYRELSRDSLLVNSPNPYLVNRNYSNKGIMILEPCLINKVGKNNLSAVIQGQVIIPLASEIDLRYANFSPVFLFSLGVQYNFVFKKQKEPK